MHDSRQGLNDLGYGYKYTYGGWDANLDGRRVLYASSDGNFNRSWLKIDHVDPHQSTQYHTIGVVVLQEDNHQ